VVLFVLLPGQGFPDRRPFGARRGNDIFDAEIAERLDDGFAAILLIFHVIPPEI
jgi:hypothetical protein